MGQRLSTAVKLHKNRSNSTQAVPADNGDEILKDTNSQDQIDQRSSEVFISTRAESMERRRLSGVFVGDIRRDSIGTRTLK